MTISALTDTQLVLLSAASQREDGLLVQPERLRGAIAQSVIARLLAEGAVEEIAVDHSRPSWRQDDNGNFIGLKITAIGLTAIGVGHDGEGSAPESIAQPGEEPGTHRSEEPHQARPERPGTKRALVISLLQREEGADLDDLMEATAWLPHTTRAALTGLRQKGYAISKHKGAQGQTVYSIKDAGPIDPEGCDNRDMAPTEAV